MQNSIVLFVTTAAIIVTLTSTSAVAQSCGCSSCADSAYPGVPDFKAPSFGEQNYYAPASSYMGNFANPASFPATAPMQIAPQDLILPQFQSHGSHAIEQPFPGNGNFSKRPRRNYAKAKTLSLFGGLNSTMLMDEDNLFAEGSVGGDFDDGFVTGLSFGRRHSRWLRSEIEFAYRMDSAEKFIDISPAGLISPRFEGDMEVYSGIFNVYFDFANPTPVTPYLGIGVGYGYVNGDVRYAGFNYSAEENSALTAQAMAGISARFDSRFELYAEFRLVGTEDLEFRTPVSFAPVFDGPYLAADIVGGLRINF